MEFPSQAEVVVWRDGERRCELWIISGVPHLRVYDGDELKHEERAGPTENTLGRAQELRLLPTPPRKRSP